MTAGLCLAASTALSGCATAFHDSAPADEGDLYIVGGKVKIFQGWQPTVSDVVGPVLVTSPGPDGSRVHA